MVLISIILIVTIILLFSFIYQKYLDYNCSSYATVVSIDGDALVFKVEDNQFLDPDIYCTTVTVFEVAKDTNGKDIDKFKLKSGNKIKVTANPKKLEFYHYSKDFTVLDGLVRLEFVSEN